MRILITLLFCTFICSCSKKDLYYADVKITIDGKNYDYTTKVAELENLIENEIDQDVSLYLLREDKKELPSLSLRYYSRNPVGYLLLRHEHFDSKYECYTYPNRKEDRNRLSELQNLRIEQKKKELDKTQVGQKDCIVKLKKDKDNLIFNFDAILHTKAKDKKETSVKLKAMATIKLQKT